MERPAFILGALAIPLTSSAHVALDTQRAAQSRSSRSPTSLVLSRLHLAAVLVATAMMFACAETSDAADTSDTSAVDGLDGLSPDDSSSQPDVPAGACTALQLGGAAVPETAGIVFFGPSGGTVRDGTYHLTEFRIFPPGTVDPFQRRHTLRVTGDRVEVVTQRDSEPEVRMTATMSLTGSTATFTTDCPGMTTYSFGYTASDTQFSHIIEGPDIKEVHVYTLQQ